MDSQARTIEVLDEVVRAWLADPTTMIVCGRWSDGSVGELLPRGRARLSGAKHEGRFAGLRDVWIEGEEHHLHVDLGRFDRATYAIAPSVCFGFRPALELRLQTAAGQVGLTLSTSEPYAAGALRVARAQAFFERLLEHQRRFGALVRFEVERPPRPPSEAASEAWRRLAETLAAQVGHELRCDDPFDAFAEITQRAALGAAS